MFFLGTPTQDKSFESVQCEEKGGSKSVHATENEVKYVGADSYGFREDRKEGDTSSMQSSEY